MDFKEMSKYSAGRSEEGHDRFAIPLQPDEEGFFGRECPNEDCDTKYFKISKIIPDGMEAIAENFSQAEITCPYCGTRANMQHFYTQAQLDWIQSMMVRDISRAFGDMLERSFSPRSHTTGGMFSISFKVKRGAPPSVRYYVEEKLKQEINCDHCGYRYAVYGISFHCPLCGEGTLSQHLDRSAMTVRVLANEAERISNEHGHEVGDRMLGNALEDVVSLFEGFLKHLYRYAIRKKLPKEESDKLIQKIKVNFQRLAGAEEFFKRDFDVDLFKNISTADRELLELSFSKRHVLTHNLGLVDEKYLDKISGWERAGAELSLEAQEVLRSLEMAVNVVKHAIKEVC
jgi:DNA-directed RNA polymerase subunit RPC12/RpoP